jgi:hypothetical protein
MGVLMRKFILMKRSLLLLTAAIFLVFFIQNAYAEVYLYPYAWYHLNELSGTTVSDSSGNNRNGITISSPTWVAGKLNNALQFSGSGQYVNTSNINFANFERTEPFSYEFWFSTSLATMEMAFSKYDTTANKGMMTYLTSGNVWFDFRGAAAGYLAVSTNETFNDGVWHHCIITYDGYSHPSGVKIYIDGTSRNLTNQKDTLGSSTMNNEYFYIGKRSAGNFWNGKIDEFVIYNKTLNATEVSFRYNNGAGTEAMSPSNVTIGSFYNYFCNGIQSVENHTVNGVSSLIGIPCAYGCSEGNSINYVTGRSPQGDICSLSPSIIYGELLGAVIVLILLYLFIRPKIGNTALDATVVLILVVATLLFINSMNLPFQKQLLYPFPVIFLIIWIIYAFYPRD